MDAQTLLFLLLGAVQVLGAPTKNLHEGPPRRTTKDLSLDSKHDNPVVESQVSHKEGRLIPLLIYDDGTGTSHLVQTTASAAARLSDNTASQAPPASLIQSLINPVNFNTETDNGRKLLFPFPIPLLGIPGIPGTGTVGFSPPNITLPTLTQAQIANLIPVVRDLLTMFPFLSNFPGFNQLQNFLNLTRNAQSVYIFSPLTGLIPITSGVTPAAKTAREGLSQPSSADLLQNIYTAYQLSLLQQQGLAMQKQSFYGNPWQKPFPISPQAYDTSYMSQLPGNQGSFGSLPYVDPIPNSLANNPFLNFAVQPPAYQNNPLSKPAVSELPFQLLKEVGLEELLGIQAQKNEGVKPEKSELKKDEEEKKLPVIAPVDLSKLNDQKETAVDQKEAEVNAPTQRDDNLGQLSTEQVRENSKFSQKITRSEDNFYAQDIAGQ